MNDSTVEARQPVLSQDLDFEQLVRLDEEHLWHPWTPSRHPDDPLMIVSGKGCVVVDARGRRYLDARGGMFNANLGYGRTEILDAMHTQARRLMTYVLTGASTPPPVLLAARLAELLGDPLTRTFFCHSGSEANETAIKIARMFHGLRGETSRQIVLSLTDGYHGSTLATSTMSQLPGVRVGFDPLPAGFASVATPRCPSCATGRDHTRCTGPGPEALDETIRDLGPHNVAAFIVEPVLGVGGIVPLPAGYLEEAGRICDHHGILLIVDEVMTGLGRTGVWFAHQHCGITPDIVTTSKGLTAGYAPLAAVTASQAVYAAFHRDPLLGGLRHGFTTGGHAVAAAAALAVLATVERDGLLANATVVGEVLLGALQRELTGAAEVRQVRGVGLLAGVELDSETRARTVSELCRGYGVLVRQQGPTLMLAPPLILKKAEAAQIAEAITASVADSSRTGGRA
ncbi:aspartate aminotransferase family protein [Nonomuraea lactucae]|uniref:aminotransferase family protein n=1 Tax=Nonomuraea lactucae TaxID=2249762 RepID=UPI000DE56DDC|nr:aminotransferase class III-fold pyridoxal phosphate-dependent enzyme [Nonomuraea lactucae]